MQPTRRYALIGAALLAVLPTVMAFQDNPDVYDEEDATRLLPQRVRQDNAKVLESMQGAWQLISLQFPELEDDHRQDKAVLLVSGAFMSIEIHIGFIRSDEELGLYMCQSGTFRLAWEDLNILRATSMIGSEYPNDIGALSFEPPGTVRTYEVEATPDTLVLKQDTVGVRFEFTRLRSRDDGVDFFGRKRVPGEEVDGELDDDEEVEEEDPDELPPEDEEMG